MSYYLLISVESNKENSFSVSPSPSLSVTVGEHIDEWIDAFKCFLLAAQFPLALINEKFAKEEDDILSLGLGANPSEKEE